LNDFVVEVLHLLQSSVRVSWVWCWSMEPIYYSGIDQNAYSQIKLIDCYLLKVLNGNALLAERFVYLRYIYLVAVFQQLGHLLRETLKREYWDPHSWFVCIEEVVCREVLLGLP
jgi:hypothetical protein